VDYGRKTLNLTMCANEQVNTILPSNAYRYKFHSTDRYNRAETISALKTVIDENGVVGNSWFHGLKVGFLHTYSDSER